MPANKFAEQTTRTIGSARYGSMCQLVQTQRPQQRRDDASVQAGFTKTVPGSSRMPTGGGGGGGGGGQGWGGGSGWPCPDCRQTATHVVSMSDSVNTLVVMFTELKDKLESVERARENEVSQWREETATLTQQNEELTRSVAALTQQVMTLTWKSFRRPNDPSVVLIIRDVDERKLHDTAAICRPGASISDIKKEVQKLPSHGHDHITLVVGANDCAAHPADATGHRRRVRGV